MSQSHLYLPLYDPAIYDRTSFLTYITYLCGLPAIISASLYCCLQSKIHKCSTYRCPPVRFTFRVPATNSWWAGWVSSPLFRQELDLQSNAFADSLPTHILNKYVEGGRHYQRQNINRTYIKERRGGRSLHIWRRIRDSNSNTISLWLLLVFRTSPLPIRVNPPFKKQSTGAGRTISTASPLKRRGLGLSSHPVPTLLTQDSPWHTYVQTGHYQCHNAYLAQFSASRKESTTNLLSRGTATSLPTVRLDFSRPVQALPDNKLRRLLFMAKMERFELSRQLPNLLSQQESLFNQLEYIFIFSKKMYPSIPSTSITTMSLQTDRPSPNYIRPAAFYIQHQNYTATQTIR